MSPTPRVRAASVLAHLLERGRATRAELEDALSATEESIKSDLKALQRAKLVEVVGHNRSRAYTVHRQVLKAALPTPDRLALVVGQQVTRFLDGTPLHPRVDGLGDLEARVRYVSEPYRRYGAHVDTVRRVLDAVLQSRRLRLEYRAAKGVSVFDPFHATNLLVYRRALYALGRIGESPKMYALALDRVVSATVGDPFEAAPFDVDLWLRGRFGLTTDEDHPEPEPIRLRFSSEVAFLVREREFHPGATVEPLRDGGVSLTMLATGKELLPFVLQWGATVVVESPTWLADAVRDALAAALRRYQFDD